MMMTMSHTLSAAEMVGTLRCEIRVGLWKRIITGRWREDLSSRELIHTLKLELSCLNIQQYFMYGNNAETRTGQNPS